MRNKIHTIHMSELHNIWAYEAREVITKRQKQNKTQRQQQFAKSPLKEK